MTDGTRSSQPQICLSFSGPHGALNPPITGVAAEHDMLYALTLPFQDE
jgi:hypothetical protein